jgi:hypothetical protein
METINLIDPSTGKVHQIPYDQLPHALESGGQFADEEQKQKAIKIQKGESSPKPLELTLTKGIKDNKADWRGLAGDAVRMLGNALKGGIGFASRVPGNLKEMGSELIHHPGTYPQHVFGQVGSALVGGVKDFANLGHEALKELGKRHIIPEWLEKYNELPFTHIPEDTGVEKFLGLKPTLKSDELARALPAVIGAGKIVGGGVKSAKELALAPSKAKAFQRALEERIAQVGEKKEFSEKDLKELEDSLKLDYSNIFGEKLGQAAPVPLREGINVKTAKIEKNRPLTEMPEEHVGEIPPEPDLKAITNEKKEAVQKAKDEADKALGTLEDPRRKGAAKVAQSIKEVHKSATDLYKAGKKHYIDKKISADNSAEIKAATEDLEALKNSDELAPGYGSGTAEQKALENTIENLKGETVQASDIFSLQRSMETMADNFRKKQFASGTGATDLQRTRWGNIADQLEAHADKLAKRLETVGGKDVQKMMKEANKSWKVYKDLEKRNPIGKGALKGQLPINTIYELYNNHPGNDFLRGLVEADPDLKKHILAAYSGTANVNKLMRAPALVKKFIQDLPEVEEHIIALKEALKGVKEGEVKASKVKKEYDETVNAIKEAANRQKIRNEAIEESEKLKKQIKFKEDAIPKIEEKLKTVEAHSVEHKRLEKELDEHKKFIQDKGGRLKELAKFFVKVKLAGKMHL